MQLPYNQDFYRTELDISATVRIPSLDEAIKRTQELLLSQQFPEGYWWADLESNATATAETVVLIKILGVESDFPMEKMQNYLLKTQRSHGGWELSYGDGGDISVTVEAYVALKLLGLEPAEPAMAKALQFIHRKGGVTKSRVLTKILLAMLGCYNWEGIPSLPPWLVLLPSWSFPTSIYDMSSWARICVVPLVIILDRKPLFRVRIRGNNDDSFSLCFDELHVEGSMDKADVRLALKGFHWRNIFIIGDRLMKIAEKFSLVPFRERGLRAAEKWVLQHQEDSGDWGGIFPGMVYSVLSLKLRGHKTGDPTIRRGMHAVRRFSTETADTCWVQASVSPVWDTGLVVRSLAESGIEKNHPALQRAGEWLLANQILQPGDWLERNSKGPSGGWAFEFFNKWYPDVDDTAVVVMALNEMTLADDDAKRCAVSRAVKWIASMQCKAGGWAAFDKNNNQAWLNEIPFADLNAMVDPNTVDVTARVVEMAVRVAAQSDLGMKEALAYLKREQEPAGCWYGRWGVNYIYGTCGAMVALALACGKECASELRRAATWLVEVQNSVRDGGDGGWGEDVRSYESAEFYGRGPSTPSQTAWAIMGLLAAGDVLGFYEAKAIEMGVAYLLGTQRSDGSWFEPRFTGTGFPGHFYIRYHYYAVHFTLTALARYRLRRSLMASSAKIVTSVVV